MDGQFFPGDPIQFEGRGSPRNPWHKRDIKEIIDGLGIGSSLKLALDAGDSSSYTSGQSWLDLSGGGYDFFLGSTSGSDATDPTFNGSAGGLSSAEYFSSDGADIFTYDSANETWMENLHKASAAYSFAVWFYPASIAATISLLRTRNTGVTVGVDFQIIGGSGRPQVVVGNGTVSQCFNPASVGGTTTAAAWNFFGCGVNVSSGAQTFQRNGTQATNTSAAYTSPSAGASARTMAMGITNIWPSGARIGMFAAWEGTDLTAAQLMQIYTATRGRYGV